MPARSLGRSVSTATITATITQFISNYLDIYVKDALKRIQGVADVQIFGERKYSMRLWLDPSRLAARGLTATDVVSALAAAERADRRRPGRPGARSEGPDVSDQRARRWDV